MGMAVGRIWRSQTIQAYKRLTKRAEAIVANTCLAGTHTRRVRRALAGRVRGQVGNDAVSRAWRKVKTDWESWQARDSSSEDIVRLILDGKRQAKTQCALPNAETATILFRALMASGQITMRRVVGWQTLDQAPVKQPIDRAA